MSRLRWLPLVIAAVSVVPLATAGTITFDESPATNDTPTPYGTTILGVTFSATNAGTWNGNSQGDPGNWLLEGTNGPQFLGFNGGYGETLAFLSPVYNFSADFSRGNGSLDGIITLSAFNGGTLLGTTTGALGSINTWSTLSLNVSGITSITWSGTGTDFHPYGVDNINFSSGAVPEPASYILFGAGMFALIALSRLRRSRSECLPVARST